MNYKIEKMSAFKIIGFQKEFHMDNSYQEIPKFWGEIFGKYFSHLSEEKGTMIEEAIKRYRIGEYGVCIDDNKKQTFQYLIAGEYTGGEVPEGLSLHEFEEGLWIIFDCVGPLPTSLQDLNTKIFKEFLPNNQEYEMSMSASIEWYDEGDTDSPNYHSQIWIPVKKK